MKRIVCLIFSFPLALFIHAQAYISPLDGNYFKPDDEKPCTRHVELTGDGVNVTYNFNYYQSTTDPLYPDTKTLKMDGFGFNYVVGQPAILRRMDSFTIPDGTKAELIITEMKYIDLPMRLSPAYPILSDNNFEEYSRENVPPILAYTGFYPVEPVSFQKMEEYRGTAIGSYCIQPVQYNYETSTVRIYSKISYKINFIGNPTKSVNSRISPNDYFLRNTTLNQGLFENPSKRSSTRSNSVEVTKDYLIITVPSLLEAVNRFAEWKRMMGYNVIISSSNSWNPNNIISEVRAKYNSCNNLYYLLIVGSHTLIPTKLSQYPNVFSDYDYGRVNNSTLQSIYVGRLPVTSLYEANTVFDKIMNYERDPVLNSNFYSRGIHSAQFLCNNDGYEIRRYTQTAERILRHMDLHNKDTIRAYYTDTANNPLLWTNLSRYFGSDNDSIPKFLRKPTFQWNGSANDIIYYINDGIFYAFYRGHGQISEWYRPNFNVSHLQQLDNGNLLPVFFNICCFTGQFYHPYDRCLADSLLTMRGGGAVGVFASVYDSPAGPDDAMAEGMFESIWPEPRLLDTFGKNGYVGIPMEPVYELGMILRQGLDKMDDIYVGYPDPSYDFTEVCNQQRYFFHCFGDPSMEIRTDVPTSFSNINIERTVIGVTVSLGSESGRIVFYNTNTGTVTAYEGDYAEYYNDPLSVIVCVYGHNKIPYIDYPSYYFQNETVTGNLTINANVIKSGTNVTSTKPQGAVIFDGGEINLIGNSVEMEGETTVTLGTIMNINNQ